MPSLSSTPSSGDRSINPNQDLSGNIFLTLMGLFIVFGYYTAVSVLKFAQRSHG